MIIHYTISTEQAIYSFAVNKDADLVRVTRWILKGNKGVHCSTSMRVEAAKKLAIKLKTR